MKQITMDFETYEKELRQAKLDGFELTQGLHAKLIKILRGVRGYSIMDQKDAIYSLAELVDKLEVLSAAPVNDGESK